MGSAGVIVGVALLAILFIPSVRNAVVGFFVRKQGGAVQRSVTGGKLFSEVGEDIGKQSVSFGEQFQKDVFEGLLIK